MTETKHTAAQPLDLDSLCANLDKLSAAIMNLPCKMGRAIEMNGASAQVYKEGHRDARHAAIELVNEQVALIAQARTARLDTTASASGDERALFERLVKGTDVNLERGFGDEYRWMNTAKMFSGFKLGRATLAPVSAQQAAAKAPAAQADAVAAMERAKKLPVWDDINHDLHKELDIIFKALAASPASTPKASHQAAAVAAPSVLPKWIDDHKGADPFMDDVIAYIETLLSNRNAATTSDDARDAALEEAALAAEKVQDDYTESQGGKWPELRDDAATGAGDCATAIRALKSGATQQEGGNE